LDENEKKIHRTRQRQGNIQAVQDLVEGNLGNAMLSSSHYPWTLIPMVKLAVQ
jgi:hypothetical protein